MKRWIFMFLLLLSGCTSPKAANLPSPTNSPTDTAITTPPRLENSPTSSYSTNQNWQTLVAAWHDSLLAKGVGWVHIHATKIYGDKRIKLPNGTHLTGNINEAQWYRIDENGLVVEYIVIQRNNRGEDIQVVIFQNGVIRNLTFGDEVPQEPYTAEFDHGLLALAQQSAPEIRETRWGNQTALLLIFQEKSASGSTIAENHYMINFQNGQIFNYERIEKPGSSSPEVIEKINFNLIERADHPTPEIQLYLDEGVRTFQTELANLQPTITPPGNLTPSRTKAFTGQEILEEIHDLRNRRETELLAQPGWLHIHIHHYSTQDHGILPNGVPIPSDRLDEFWYLIDENQQVISSITTMVSRENRVVQVSTFQNGVSRNLTLGTEEKTTPYPIRLDLNFENYAAMIVAQGGQIDRTEISLGDGSPAIQYAAHENHNAGFTQIATFNAETGALLGLALYEIQKGEQVLVWQEAILAEHRVEQPLQEALAYFDQKPNLYRPAPPEGQPAPLGFDPSGYKLHFNYVFGDDIDHPTFFLVDIFTRDYFIGRFDSGSVPGGWCDRSPDGRRIAFNYVVSPSDSEHHAFLHWFSLIDRNIKAPLPEIELLSPVTWAPDSLHLAFSGMSNGDYEQRALYVFNIETGELTHLEPAAASLWQPLWSRDGRYVISVTTEENLENPQLYVIDYRSGEIYYQGPFDLDRWEAAPDSPTHAWKIRIPRGMSGFERCEFP